MQNIIKRYPDIEKFAKENEIGSEDALNFIISSGLLYVKQRSLANKDAGKSAVIGQKAEVRVLNLIKSRFGEMANAARCNKVAKSGDIEFELEGNSIIVEVKEYAKTVPSKEIEKYHRDMKAVSARKIKEGKQPPKYGIFIAFNSGITGYKSNIVFERGDNYTSVIIPHADQAKAEAGIIALHAMIKDGNDKETKKQLNNTELLAGMIRKSAGKNDEIMENAKHVQLQFNDLISDLISKCSLDNNLIEQFDGQ